MSQEKYFEKKRRTTLSEIARELGVSVMTVSNAYNRPGQLSTELRDRIFQTAERLGFSGPDPAARSLRRGRAGAIGVLYTNHLSYAFADPAAVLFLEGVARAVEEAGLGMVLIPGTPVEYRQNSFISQAVVDGFIIYSMAKGDPMVKAALDRQLPAVLVDQLPEAGYPSVAIADAAGTAQVTRHLLNLGHTAFGIVSMPLCADGRAGLVDPDRLAAATYKVSYDRLEGCRQALQEAGLSWAGVPIYECNLNSIEQGRLAGQQLLTDYPATTAVITLTDQLAIGVLQAAADLGRPVPANLSIAGFDDNPVAAHLSPPLTTVRQPMIEKGHLAGQLLIARLEQRELPNPLPLPTTLVVRASTAAPPANLPG